MIVHFIATRHSIDINYTYLEKIISWGISPPENGSVKSVDLLNQSIVKMALIGACSLRRIWRLSEGQTWLCQKLLMKI